MTQDEIIEIYTEVSNKLCNGTEWCWSGVGQPLQLFAKLVAAKERERMAFRATPNDWSKALIEAEREACAKVARQISDKYAYGYYGNEVDTADEIEAAIRARGEA